MPAAPSDSRRPASRGNPAAGTAVEAGPRLSEHPSRSDSADLPGSIQDQLCFRLAQGLLAGMCGCTEQRAGLALLSTAARHGINSARIGAQFLAALKDDPAGPPNVSSDAEQLVLSVVEAASLPPCLGGPRTGSLPVAQPEPLHLDTDRQLRIRPAPVHPARTNGTARGGRSAMPAEAGRALLIEGELDMATGPQLHDRAQELGWGRHSPDNANQLRQLDLSGVTFIDISGVHALTDVHAYVAERGGQLQVTPPENLGPRRLLTYAVKSGWLAPRFAPADPTRPRAHDLGTPDPTRLSGSETNRKRPE